MPGKRSFRKRSALLALLLVSPLLGAACAQTESVLYNFPNGWEPNGGLVFDQKGNLYGTTWFGGDDNNGVVYKLTPEGKETILYAFCPKGEPCFDGEYPLASLVLDRNENLYGTASAGGRRKCFDGDYACGVVFKLTPKGKETVLYSFCAQDNCADGRYPTAGVVFDQKGNLYGTTSYGGATEDCPDAYTGCGVVFKLSPCGKETVLYRFCAHANCTDGWFPISGVILDEKGNLYGTTILGGAYGQGTVFKVTPEGKETVLDSFCEQGGTQCTDGAMPFAPVALDRKGNLYGATRYGGAGSSCLGTYGCGVVFELTPHGKYTVLYNFCSQSNCADGAEPNGVILDAKGSLYGTAFYGGAYYYGTAFRLSPTGEETVLYSFCSQDNCADGSYPGWVIFGQTGNLYGTTEFGGADRGGVVFKLTP